MGLGIERQAELEHSTSTAWERTTRSLQAEFKYKGGMVIFFIGGAGDDFHQSVRVLECIQKVCNPSYASTHQLPSWVLLGI